MTLNITWFKPVGYLFMEPSLTYCVCMYVTAVNYVAELQLTVQERWALMRNMPEVLQCLRQASLRSAVRCRSTRTKFWSYFVMCYQNSDLQIWIRRFVSKHISTEGFTLFCPSASKINWAITHRRSVQVLMFTEMFLVNCVRTTPRPKVLHCILETPEFRDEHHNN